MDENKQDNNKEFYSSTCKYVNPTMLFCEQHGWTGVSEGVCYGALSCKDAAVCVLAANFAAMHGKKNALL